MSLDALRILSGNQELTSPIDNIPSPSSSAFNAQNLCLNNGLYYISKFKKY